MSGAPDISQDLAVQRLVREHQISGAVAGMLVIIQRQAFWIGMLIGLLIALVLIVLWQFYEIREALVLLDIHVDNLRQKR